MGIAEVMNNSMFLGILNCILILTDQDTIYVESWQLAVTKFDEECLQRQLLHENL